MPREGYTVVTISEELYGKLEDERKKRGLRSIPKTIQSLLDEAKKSKVKAKP